MGTSGPETMAALVGLFLTAFAIALAWLLYRLERLHARHRDLDAALAVLNGVRRGMVEGVGDEKAWAELYFATVYTPGSQELADRVHDASVSISRNQWAMQVFPVPLAPLELIVSSPATASLISDETVFISNFGLWRIGIFNELVRLQTNFNARMISEIRDEALDLDRRGAIIRGATWIAEQIHLYGIDGANAEGGWYARLKRALDADIKLLAEEREQGFSDYGESRRWFLLGDLGMAALVVASAVMVTVGAICKLT
jgi:hypothetical protein